MQNENVLSFYDILLQKDFTQLIYQFPKQHSSYKVTKTHFKESFSI